MNIVETGFPGLLIIEPQVFKDKRGYFLESYNLLKLKDKNIQYDFVQDNQSRSTYGVIRGLHYQREPWAQTKLIRALSGTILDVVVDIRKGSPTFGKTFSLELSEDNFKQLLIPRGFAHGFSVLSPTAVILYKCDNFYSKESEGGICYNDPELKIDWQIPADKAIVSEKDEQLPLFSDLGIDFRFA